MRSPLHQLMLIGMICQALSWDDYVWPAIVTLLWFAGVNLKRPIIFGSIFESVLLILGATTAYVLGVALGNSTHFFIGHGLILVQLVRLLRPLTLREKYVTLVIACFHLAVACTFLYDTRFLIVFIAAVLTFPRVLHELSTERYSQGPSTFSIPRYWRSFLALFSITVIFFLFFPRTSVGQLRMPGPNRMPGQGTLIDAVIDPIRSGATLSGKTLLQIEGKSLGYLRCFALVDYEGGQWKSLADPLLRRIQKRNPRPEIDLRRRVRVKNPLYLSKVLPVDGQVINIEGQFFRGEMLNSYGAISTLNMWNTPNNVYEYWITPDKRPEWLTPSAIQRHLRHPPQSRRLTTWLQNFTKDVEDPLQQARALEGYFRSNFVYNLGAPALNRLNPVDDFMFKERQGHCERYATTLALLLRMKGIPSRVVIGYVPTGRDFFSGWYNIRFKDAHAWTEGFFPELGWVEFDATPRRSISRESWDITEALETLDFFWNAHVINYDGIMQQNLISGTIDVLNAVAIWLSQRARTMILPIMGVLAFGLLLLQYFRSRRVTAKVSRTKAAVIASGQYGEMLKAFARKGLPKQPQQTPIEFLQEIRSRRQTVYAPAEQLTEFFCQTRYGERTISHEEINELHHLVRQIKSGLREKA